MHALLTPSQRGLNVVMLPVCPSVRRSASETWPGVIDVSSRWKTSSPAVKFMLAAGAYRGARVLLLVCYYKFFFWPEQLYRPQTHTSLPCDHQPASMQLTTLKATFPWQDFLPDTSLTFPWLLVQDAQLSQRDRAMRNVIEFCWDTQRTYTCPTQQCHFERPLVTLSDLAKHSMTRSVVQFLCDSWASCLLLAGDIELNPGHTNFTVCTLNIRSLLHPLHSATISDFIDSLNPDFLSYWNLDKTYYDLYWTWWLHPT